MTYVDSFEWEKSFWDLLQAAENELHFCIVCEIDQDAFVSTCIISSFLSCQCLRARFSLCLSRPSNIINFLREKLLH